MSRVNERTGETAIAAATFEVRLFGPFAVKRDGQALAVDAWPRGARRLFCSLALSPGSRLQRDELIDRLWPESAPEAGAVNLRHAIFSARRGLDGGEPSPITVERGWVSLNPAHRWDIDFVAVEQLAATNDVGSWEAAAGLCSGELVEQDRYEEWAAVPRERAARLRRSLLLKLGNHAVNVAPLEAVDWYEQALAEDPLDEEALAGLLRALLRVNRGAEALRAYRAFERRLRDELDVSPSPPTANLVAALARPRRDGETFRPDVLDDAVPLHVGAHLPPPAPQPARPVGRSGIPVRVLTLVSVPGIALVVALVAWALTLRPAPARVVTHSLPSVMAMEPTTVWRSTSGAFHLGDPFAIAVDRAGDLMVADNPCLPLSNPACYDVSADRLSIVTPWGDVLAERHGGALYGAMSALAIDGSGILYVINSDTVEKISPQGRLIMSAGRAGDKPGTFDQPAHLAVNRAGDIYIADTGNNRIQELSPQGAVLRVWGRAGSGPGAFLFPSGIALDSAGSVYVADTGNNRIEKFAPDGSFVAQWGTKGAAAGQMRGPLDVAVFGQTVYVADATNNRVDVYSSDGQSRGAWTATGMGGLRDPRDVITDARGHVYVMDAGHRRVIACNSAGTPVGQWGGNRPNNFSVRDPSAIAADGQGGAYIADTGNNRVIHVSALGAVSQAWSSAAGERLRSPRGVATDGQGDVFVADTGGHRVIQLHDGHWRPFAPAFPWDAPVAIAVDAHNRVYVADDATGGVDGFSAEGRHLSTWGTPGRDGAPGELYRPEGLAIDRQGDVFVADAHFNRVQEFDPNGQVADTFGSLGSGVGQVRSPEGIATDREGHVFVADTGNNRIQEFSASFALLATRSRQLYRPTGIALDSHHRLYVVNAGRNQIQVYSLLRGGRE